MVGGVTQTSSWLWRFAWILFCRPEVWKFDHLVIKLCFPSEVMIWICHTCSTKQKKIQSFEQKCSAFQNRRADVVSLCLLVFQSEHQSVFSSASSSEPSSPLRLPCVMWISPGRLVFRLRQDGILRERSGHEEAETTSGLWLLSAAAALTPEAEEQVEKLLELVPFCFRRKWHGASQRANGRTRTPACLCLFSVGADSCHLPGQSRVFDDVQMPLTNSTVLLNIIYPTKD